MKPLTNTQIIIGVLAGMAVVYSIIFLYASVAS